jgi:two-component system sensor histidine kinase UhpB
MVAILVMVAISADRGMAASRRYAALYLQASDKLITAQEDERRRLALDLHDGVGQTITAISLTLDATSTSLRSGAEDAVSLSASRIDRARTLADAALDETRRVAANLMPARLSTRGLGAAVEELATTAGMSIDTQVADETRVPGLLSPDVEVGIFRIIQESIANAARHAQAERVHVVLRVHRGNFIAEIVDNGRGFVVSARESRSLGITGMHERAETIGARLRIHSRIGVGTTVELSVPLRLNPAATQSRLPAVSSGQPDGIASRGA